MKKIIFLGILLCLTLTSYAQNIHIPDANFKNALLASSINTNNDANISKQEAEKALSIKAINKNIQNLTGIEHFINLKHLTIPKNKVTSLNLTKNTKLQYLDVGQNQLTNLNISGCTQLERLDANSNQLAQLDVSKNAILFELKIYNNKFKRINIDSNTKLSILHAWTNQLEELNSTKNLNLTRLYVWGNKLTSLDVSKNTKLDELNIGNNLLTTIDASKNTMLTHLDVRESLLTSLKLPVTSTLRRINVEKNKLTSINLTGNSNLERLDIGSNALTEIDLSKNINLVYLYCSKNKITKLDARNCKIVNLDVSDNSELKTMFLTHRYLSKYIKIDKCPKLEFICLHKYYSDTAYIQNRVDALGYNCVISSDCSLAPTSKIINFNDPNFKAGLVSKYDIDGDNQISVDEAEKVGVINLENKNISNIIGIEYFVNLRVLLLKNNQISSVNLSKNNKLNTIDLANNKLTSIDLSNKTLLRYLTLDNNQLLQISLNSSVDLQVLRLSNNQITTLDITSNTNLETVDVSRNLISKIDIRNCKSVNKLNISNNPNLREAYLTGNHSFYQSYQHFSGVVHHARRLYLDGCPKLNFVCVNSVSFLNEINNYIRFTLGYSKCNVNTSCKPTKTSAFDNHFILSPNPASNYLAITPKDPLTTGNATVTILRLSGEIVKKVVVKFIVDPRDELIKEDPFAAPIPKGTNDILMGLNSVLIDVTGLPVGQYILHLQSSKGLLTTKFIKN
ncbi:Leucine-rich repeat (LRR) protein [Aquimarina sp. EL_43]|uniref:leucine-rich repeat domain-containing protein n=1 Tax=Aquimarina TaxID=290174 RepID=UPI00046F7495|nr:MULTISPECIES: leucine-rich repeat domain-containing protein [Aquimarina]MBG6130519.1 Leucine-rich repeat (LRR) protein [Aquimarina sp. EL_35]MBG6149299.1 Leucine-rich repeat (LRR) protein [Aquimarina sp. EL_32]MBG6168327.1 Leucine-rich repeat (LRR) protein [Aquimarina sp. EL_43]